MDVAGIKKTTLQQESNVLPRDRERHLGEVVWFNSIKGYGFIHPHDAAVNNGKDLFVHFHYIVQRGFKTLRQGDVVEFSLGKNQQGVCAQEVKLVKAAVEEI